MDGCLEGEGCGDVQRYVGDGAGQTVPGYLEAWMGLKGRGGGREGGIQRRMREAGQSEELHAASSLVCFHLHLCLHLSNHLLHAPQLQRGRKREEKKRDYNQC